MKICYTIHNTLCCATQNVNDKDVHSGTHVPAFAVEFLNSMNPTQEGGFEMIIYMLWLFRWLLGGPSDGFGVK